MMGKIDCLIVFIFRTDVHSEHYMNLDLFEISVALVLKITKHLGSIHSERQR